MFVCAANIIGANIKVVARDKGVYLSEYFTQFRPGIEWLISF